MFGRERVELKDGSQVRAMRAAGLVVADALAAIRAEVRPGVTTAELDAVARDVLARAGATSSFLGYGGVGAPPYPAVTCISVNDEIVHGIPGERVLESGDIVSVDFGAIVDGWHGDSAFSAVLDPTDPADVALVTTTEDALWAGVAALATPGGRLGAVGEAVEDVVEAAGVPYGIVEDYVGHGIGTAMHQPPDVPNYRTKDRGTKLRAGLCVAVEPMLVRGAEANHVLADDWTVVTDDGSRAAHWEHSVAILEDGIVVLTARDGGAARLRALGVEVASL